MAMVKAFIMHPISQDQAVYANSFRSWMQHIPHYAKHWLVMVMLSFILELAQYGPMILMQYVTDTVLAQQAYDQLWTVLWVLLVVSGVLIGLQAWKQVVFLRMFRRFQRNFCASILHHVLHIPWEAQQQLKSSMSMLLASCENIQKKLTLEAVEFGLDGGLIVLNVLILACYPFHLLLMVGLGFVLTLMGRYLTYRWQKDDHQIAFDARTQMTAHHLDTLSGLLPIKAHAQESLRWSQWLDRYTQWIHADMHHALKQGLGQSWIQVIQTLESLVLISVGVMDIQHQRCTLGEFMVFLSIRSVLMTRINQFIVRGFDYRLAQWDLHRVHRVVQTSSEYQSSRPVALPCITGRLHVEDLFYRYDALQSPLLQGINVQIAPGEKLAITGASGCGKSTLIKLMMGLMAPHEGYIRVDGCDLQQMNLAHYRQNIASVMQDDHLFQDSILDNITWYALDPDRDRVFELLEKLQLSTWIHHLPQGVHTPLNASGVMPSGGQKQRLLLARALYRQPKILFLDEVSAHWDEALEERITDYVLALPMTQIMIAHRPKTLARVSRVWSLTLPMPPKLIH
jgi:ATP-binding cassette subfamily B protein RaxB